MSVLLLCFCATLRAWGIQSRFSVRDSARDPSKSGVIGLLAAAQGRSRSAAIEDLAALRMGVRVDQEGALLRDYHTAQEVYRAKGGVKPTELSTRYYLGDACFLVGLEGDPTLLSVLHAALRDPVWALYLGRRAFPPGEPLWLADGLREGELLEALVNSELTRSLARFAVMLARAMATPQARQAVRDGTLPTPVRWWLPPRLPRQPKAAPSRYNFSSCLRTFHMRKRPKTFIKLE